MSKSFDVVIEPAIPAAIEAKEVQIDPSMYEDIAENVKEEYSLIYVVNGERFGYYPDSILSLIFDIDGEIEKLNAKSSHHIDIGGYQVLFARVDPDRLYFFDPTQSESYEDVSAALAAASLDEVRMLLLKHRRAVSELMWRHLAAPS
jgi:hypothetical protein